MSAMHFFTSVTCCYIPKARVLAKTLKATNPSAIMHLVIADDLPKNFDIKKEPFDYIWYAEDFIETKNNKHWFYYHTVVELCTAIKAAATLHIMNKTNAKKICYLDPDIGVFGELSSLFEMLDKNSVLLTPHQTKPSLTLSSIKDDEICSLKHGIFNFGFFAVANDTNGRLFLDWWNHRLTHFCYDDIPNGLFTDQKWGDLIPALFPFAKIIYDDVYNVATWNLEHRSITCENNIWLVNKKPLKFYHFSGFDSGAHRQVLKRFAKEGDPVWDLSQLYEDMLSQNGQEELGKIQYKYACYESGNKIQTKHRLLFRNRLDLMNVFANPFSKECELWMISNCSESDCNESVISCVKNMIIFKLKYKLSFGSIRISNKQKYLYYKNKINEYDSIISKFSK